MSTVFRAGQKMIAAALNTVVTGIRELFPIYAADQDAAATTTSGSWTPTLTGGSGCSTTFVAPSSGVVEIYIAAEFVNSASSICRLGYELREGNVIGSGTVVQAADAARDVGHTGTSPSVQGALHKVSGLTPGATYNVQQMFIVGGGTGTYTYRRLSVHPRANTDL